MFMLGEFMAVITMSSRGGHALPGRPDPADPEPLRRPSRGLASYLTALWGLAAFAVKVFGFVFVFVWLRGTLPRLRYDRLMDLGWKVMLPAVAGVGAWPPGFAVVFQQQERPQHRAVLTIARRPRRRAGHLPRREPARLLARALRPMWAGGGGGGGTGTGGTRRARPAGPRSTPASETVNVETGAGSYVDRPLGADALPDETGGPGAPRPTRTPNPGASPSRSAAPARRAP